MQLYAMLEGMPNSSTRRTVLQTIGSVVGASVAGGVVTARGSKGGSSVDGVRLQGSVESSISPETIRKVQQARTADWLDIGTEGVRPAAVPEAPGDRAIVDFQLFTIGPNVLTYVGTAADEASARSARADGEQFHAAVQDLARSGRAQTAGVSSQDLEAASSGGTVGTTASGNPNLDTENWDWSVFGRYNAVDKPAGKVTYGSTWLGKEDCPNSGNYGYGIVTDWDQIPGTTVDEWSSGGHWWNWTADELNGMRNEWDRGDFDVTGYEYGPKNAPESHTYSFQAGFTGSDPPVPTPTLSVGFSTTVEGGAKNDSDYTQPKADHWYNILDGGWGGSHESQTQVVSMAPAASGYIDKSQIDSSNQTLTRVTAIGAFENTGFSWDTSRPKQPVVYLI